MKTYCFDVDGTICTKTNSDYEKALPIQKMVDKINKLYDNGHTIVIFTARGQSSGKEWTNFTLKQLKDWGLKFHRYYVKPSADYYIDDKGITPSQFLEHVQEEESLVQQFYNWKIKIIKEKKKKKKKG